MKPLLLLLMSLLAGPAFASDLLSIAAASDLTYCMDDLAAGFRREMPGVQVKVSIDASGTLFRQMKNGAGYDVFLSADMAYPGKLATEAGAVAASLAPFAIGRVALWSVDPRFDMRQGMRVLTDSRLTRLAIANPDVAPYGRAAKAALESHGFWDAVKGKLVLGENVAQATKLVQAKQAEIGVVSMSTLLSPKFKGVGHYYLIPDTGVPPIEHGAIITSHGKDNPAAARFLAFLQTPAGREILHRHGFGLPRHPTVPAAGLAGPTSQHH
jgi:molybdate transport system substrate-binding protein